MSMNIHLMGRRDIIVVKTGEKLEQTTSCSLWQTPTEVSYKIARDESPFEVYAAWCRSVSSVQRQPIYALGDLFHEREPVGVKEYNPADYHLSEVGLWLDLTVQAGYTVEWVVL